MATSVSFRTRSQNELPPYQHTATAASNNEPISRKSIDTITPSQDPNQGKLAPGPTAPQGDFSLSDCFSMVMTTVFTFIIPVWPIVALFVWLFKSNKAEAIPPQMTEALELIKAKQTPKDNTEASKAEMIRSQMFAILHSYHNAMRPLETEEAPGYGYVLWPWMSSWAPEIKTPAYDQKKLQQAFVALYYALPASTKYILARVDEDSKTKDVELKAFEEAIIDKLFDDVKNLNEFVLERCLNLFKGSLGVSPAPLMAALLGFYRDRAAFVEMLKSLPPSFDPKEAHKAFGKPFMDLFFAEPSKSKDVRDISEDYFQENLLRIFTSLPLEIKEPFVTLMKMFLENFAVTHAGPKQEQAAVDAAWANFKKEAPALFARFRLIGLGDTAPVLPAKSSVA